MHGELRGMVHRGAVEVSGVTRIRGLQSVIRRAAGQATGEYFRRCCSGVRGCDRLRRGRCVVVLRGVARLGR